MISSVKNIFWAALIGIASSILAIAVSETNLVKNWEFKTYDLRMKAAQKSRPKPQSVVMFYVDEPSLRHMEEQGINWPWPRELYASALDFCRRGRARVVFFDMFYSEDSVYGVDDDNAFALGVAAGPPSYFALFLSKNEIDPDNRAPIVIGKSKIPFVSPVPLWTEDFTSLMSLAILPLVESAKGFGNVQLPPDDDGVYRRIALLERLGGDVIPSAPLKIASDVSDAKEILWPEKTKFNFGETKIPLDDDGKMLINYYGGTDTFSSYPLAAILASDAQIAAGKTPDIDPNVVKDKVVVIGIAAPGLYDIKSTPFSRVYPAPEIHATIIENLLSADFITPVHKTASAIITLFFGLGLAIGLIWISSSWAIFAWCIGTLSVAITASFVLFYQGIAMRVIAPSGAAALSSFAMIFRNYLTEGRKKREIKHAFGQYLSPHIVSEIAKNPDALALGGREHEVTLFFSDIADFTTISEKTSPPELVKKLNEYFSTATRIIQNRGGTLDKYIGDAIMAFWGAPLLTSDHAAQAILSALEIQRTPASQFITRIGIHTGRAVIGNIGSDVRFNYTAIGDTVNLASRLEGLNKQFGTRIIASEMARLGAGSVIEARRVGRVRVKGKTEAIGIYEPLGVAGDWGKLGKEVCVKFENALAYFESARFKDACEIFAELANKNSDKTSQIYFDICEKYLHETPKDFDGVITFTTK